MFLNKNGCVKMVTLCPKTVTCQELYNPSFGKTDLMEWQLNLRKKNSTVDLIQPNQAVLAKGNFVEKTQTNAKTHAKVKLFAESFPFKNKAPDWIENTTLQIFTHLCSFADRIKRTDIEAAVKTDNASAPSQLKNTTHNFHVFFQDMEGPVSEKNLHSPKLKTSYSQKINPYQNDNNFYENEDEGVKGSQSIVRIILSIFTNLFFGWELVDPKRDKRTNKDWKKVLSKDESMWNCIKINYQDNLHGGMEKVFNKAQKLMGDRIKSEKNVYYHRVTLYAMLIISGVGRLIKNNPVTIFGLVASSITLISMIAQYGMNSFKLTEQGMDLKTSVENIYIETAKNRLPSQWKLNANQEDDLHDLINQD